MSVIASPDGMSGGDPASILVARVGASAQPVGVAVVGHQLRQLSGGKPVAGVGAGA